mgnify:CR=1 FL=1
MTATIEFLPMLGRYYSVQLNGKPIGGIRRLGVTNKVWSINIPGLNSNVAGRKFRDISSVSRVHFRFIKDAKAAVIAHLTMGDNS